jgi:hypothetical protein
VVDGTDLARLTHCNKPDEIVEDGGDSKTDHDQRPLFAVEFEHSFLVASTEHRWIGHDSGILPDGDRFRKSEVEKIETLSMVR